MRTRGSEPWATSTKINTPQLKAPGTALGSSPTLCPHFRPNDVYLNFLMRQMIKNLALAADWEVVLVRETPGGSQDKPHWTQCPATGHDLCPKHSTQGCRGNPASSATLSTVSPLQGRRWPRDTTQWGSVASKRGFHTLRAPGPGQLPDSRSLVLQLWKRDPQL